MSIKLNIGSGKNPKEGYINVDIKKDFCPDIVADVRVLPFPNNHAEEILARDVIEHVKHKEVERTLKEWYRVLKKGGKIIIQTPNLKTIARMILDSNDVENHNLMIKRLFGGQDYFENGHYACQTPESLMDKLQKVGFKKIECTDVEDLETPDYPTNMVVRAEK